MRKYKRDSFTPEQFREILPVICDRETSVNSNKWTSQDLLWGHCATIALLAQELFGGTLRVSPLSKSSPDDRHQHYWNRFEGDHEEDFTIPRGEGEKLSDRVSVSGDRKKLLGYHSSDTQRRYDSLASRLAQFFAIPPQYELRRDMQSHRRAAEGAEARIHELKDALDQERIRMRSEIVQYAVKRRMLFERKLIQHKKDWCTKCEKVVPREDVELLRTDLVTWSTKYDGSFSRTREVAHHDEHLYRACSSCHKETLVQHGLHNFSAFRVEKREDGYYAYEFGKWEKCAEITHEFPEIPYDLIEKYAEHLPPKIELERKDFLGLTDELEITEPKPQEVETAAVA